MVNSLTMASREERPPIPDVDRVRLARMFNAHHVTVWRTLRRRGLSADAAADATQQTFLLAAERLGDIRHECERAFLIETALRMAHTLGRKIVLGSHHGPARIGYQDDHPVLLRCLHGLLAVERHRYRLDVGGPATQPDRSARRRSSGSGGIVYPRGIWDKDDELVLQLDKQSDGNNVVKERPRQGPKVALATIDKLVTELGLPKVDFIKMDVEGAEPKAIQGAAQTLHKLRPRRAVSTYHRRDDLVDLLVGVREIIPTHWVSFGPCKLHEGRLVPAVLFFR
jgi:FkbM family methyltransferase